MNWQRKGDTGMISGNYRVGKFFLDGCSLYGLWHGDDLIGYFNDFDEAKQAAESHAKGVE